MARAINGERGSGSVDTYKLSPTDSFRVDSISFVLTTDATAGMRGAEVRFLNPDGSVIASMLDWNDVGPTAVVTYTFAVSLTPFSCSVATGGSVQHDLPFTQLETSCIVQIRSVDLAGAVVPGDAFTNIVLWVEDGGAASLDDVIPPYTLTEQAAA